MLFNTLRTSGALAAGVVALTACSSALAFSGGAPEGFSGGPSSGFLDCSICHAEFPANSGPGSIGVQGLPALYVPDEIYALRVRIEDTTKVGAGFELSVEDASGNFIGDLIVADATNTRSAGSDPILFMTHTSAGKANAITDWSAMGSAAEFVVQWRAPSTEMGDINFHVAGVAINNGTANSGDLVYTATIPRSPASLGDLNGDGAVDTADLGKLINAFGSADPVADLNNDSIVDPSDLSMLISAFGR